MQALFKISSIFLLMCFFSFCKTTIPEDYKKSKIHFGSGGGFTGAVTEYCLLENGQLFEKKGMPADSSAFIELPKIARSKVKSLFKELSTLNFPDLDYNKPGNMSYFLKTVVDGKAHRITWTQEEVPLDVAQREFYKNLMGLVNQD
jgi:hypothetical protein